MPSSLASSGLARLAIVGTTLATCTFGVVSSASATSITKGACTSSNLNWVHVTGPYGTSCYGYKGTFGFGSDNAVTMVCYGNNNGSFTYQDSTGTYTEQMESGEDVYFGDDTYLKSLTITGWTSANEPC